MRTSSRNQAYKFAVRVALSVVFLYASGTSLAYARGGLQKLKIEHKVERKPLYLPETDKVRLITLGFDRFFANILWFNTLNYFGKQLAAGADYNWLGHMCKLVSELDTKNRPVVEFCATMLSWVAQEPEISTQILRKAISVEPEYWRYRYLLGFNYWYFHEQPKKAKSILQKAALIQGAPTFLASLAARLTVQDGDPQLAIRLLDDLLRRTSDPRARQALSEKRNLAIVTRDISVLNKLIVRYEESTGKPVQKFEQLLAAGMLKELPKDPYGEVYQLDAGAREISSGKGQRGLVFNGKTATTGLARFERRRK